MTWPYILGTARERRYRPVAGFEGGGSHTFGRYGGKRPASNLSGVTDRDQPAARDRAPGERASAVSADGAACGRLRWVADAGLGAILAGLLAFWAYSVATSWGPGYWAFGCVAGAVVSVIALARRRRKAGTPAAGTHARPRALARDRCRLSRRPGTCGTAR